MTIAKDNARGLFSRQGDDGMNVQLIHSGDLKQANVREHALGPDMIQLGGHIQEERSTETKIPVSRSSSSLWGVRE